jgi:AraC-like DNA-binding protein
LLSIDLGLRGAVVGLSLLLAGVALRDRRDSTVACLAAAVMVGAAASAIGSAPTFPRPFEWWEPFVLALAGGNSVVFWLWARAAFDDDFVIRPWHGGLWAVLAGLQFYVAGWGLWPAFDLVIDRALSLTTLGLALLAAAQTLATWRTDLVAGRRRLRLVILIGASVYITIVAAANFSGTPSMSFSSMASVANAFGLFGLVGLSAWNVLRAADTQGSILLPATGDASGHRIEDAKAALADPEQREVPVLTFAMDAGFQSLGPFNRAFKAATDLTPTEFRRLATAKSASVLPGESVRSGIGKPDCGIDRPNSKFGERESQLFDRLARDTTGFNVGSGVKLHAAARLHWTSRWRGTGVAQHVVGVRAIAGRLRCSGRARRRLASRLHQRG